MTPLSVLDLSPIVVGGNAAQSLRNSLDLARSAERVGYNRLWLAEHHNMRGIASAATAVVIAHVAAGTSKIRLGAGGIMLPNHSPLMVAEAFGTLAALHPGRIDLGVGRAPGTDQLTAQALRRNLDQDINGFPQDVVELLGYFREPEEGQRVIAVPGAGLDVPVWILGSSLFGAQLAAALGLPYAFASHFAPSDLEPAIEIYRARFQPSAYLEKPYVMLGLNVFVADTDEEAKLLQTSQQQAFVNLRTGRPGPLPPPVAGYEETLDLQARAILRHSLSCSVAGSPQTAKAGVEEFIARTGADEVMVTGMIFDHAARVRSYELLAREMIQLAEPAAAEAARAG
ncbi:LLM class flavin-dependent oxidoreductase [Phyllobacterium sp. 0TCS1.6C]|uniref:LLM class flavin-dependent oxidoreductase n=1 Tax=unclassified Phyllobacterium TaxID=2638441 RepID=UPI0022641BDF|nr:MULTISPECIES: LLM class flavin-dependent oxidoreductase [unclassified Phyllobacterium]MCX8281991.1 LLM class flavin-dependent oxidoreductase [Phyllobacterium sp. 0TCS1.6C]MCX8294454.1 LLM class flavin-dependent oxidoreductase [Phyllobacterium sp. 0TCS1.6A]